MVGSVNGHPVVMPGQKQSSLRRLRKLVCDAGHPRLPSASKTWMAGHRRAEATPSFGRLCPAMTALILGTYRVWVAAYRDGALASIGSAGLTRSCRWRLAA